MSGATAGDAAPRPAVADASAAFETPTVSDDAALREFATLRQKRATMRSPPRSSI